MNDDTNQRAREEALREKINLESELACACASNERVVDVATVFRIATSAREEALREAAERLERHAQEVEKANKLPGVSAAVAETIRVAKKLVLSLITGGGEREE